MQLEYRLSALLQLHPYSPLNPWLQYIAQRQLQAKTGKSAFWDLGRLISGILRQVSEPVPLYHMVHSAAALTINIWYRNMTCQAQIPAALIL